MESGKVKLFFLVKDRVEVKFLEKIKEADNSPKIELAICLVKKIQWKLFCKSYRARYKKNNSNYFR